MPVQTTIFRIYPNSLDERKLHEILTIYNRVKRIGYKLLFNREVNNINNDGITIQKKLMNICHNNPYVNTILIDNKTRLKQQRTWFEKRKTRINKQVRIIREKIKRIKTTDNSDRRLMGLYSRLSSIENKLNNLKIEPIVFGGKQLFRERVLKKISQKEFRIKRDSSFCCVGKKQGVNLNIKLLENKTVKIHTFHKEKNKKWLFIPFSISCSQENRFLEILTANKYTATIKRRLIRNGIRYFVHISYEIKEKEFKYEFENGAIGLDFNYNFASITNIDRKGNLLSYDEINFRNLHKYRKNKRTDYASFKMDKVVNYCLNKKKGLIIEDLSFEQHFSYNRKLNRILSNFKRTMLDLLERKCIKKGVSIRKVHPAYTSLIGKYKYSRSHNLSTHTLASYVIARRGLGFKEEFPAIYKWLLSQVGDIIEPRLKKSSPYSKWSKIHDFFKYCGITSFTTSDVMKKTLLMKNVVNSVTSEQHDNLSAGLSPKGKINDWNKFWTIVENSNFYN